MCDDPKSSTNFLNFSMPIANCQCHNSFVDLEYSRVEREMSKKLIKIRNIVSKFLIANCCHSNTKNLMKIDSILIDESGF